MAHHHGNNGNSWQGRTGRDYGAHDKNFDRPISSQAFTHAHTSMGVAGHIVHILGVFVPVIAGEFVESPVKYKKVVRLASIGTAMAYEGIHVYNEVKRREKQEAKLAECQRRLMKDQSEPSLYGAGVSAGMGH